MNIKKWSELGGYQEEFAVAIAWLILWADSQSIKVRIKDAYRAPGLHGAWGERKGYGSAHSSHKVSLAVDLFTPAPIDHVRLHDHWDTLGGSKRIEDDMNHYSFEWQGYR